MSNRQNAYTLLLVFLGRLIILQNPNCLHILNMPQHSAGIYKIINTSYLGEVETLLG